MMYRLVINVSFCYCNLKKLKHKLRFNSVVVVLYGTGVHETPKIEGYRFVLE